MAMSYTVDLHTHSIASPDGALRTEDYLRMLERDRLSVIAVTDHNTTEFARQLQAELGGPDSALGKRIIVGEEIRTTEGEIIGLYLTETIPKMLTPRETVSAIRKQGGLVCIPHPFEDVRRGITESALTDIADEVDIIEVHNGRAVFQNKSKQAYAWADAHGWSGVASSDSHAVPGWGRTFTTVHAEPTRKTLVKLLKTAEYHVAFPGVRAVLYPKYNRLKKWYGRNA